MAYSTAAVYIQKKYPLDNKMWIYLGALDPAVRGTTACHTGLRKLLPYFKWLFTDGENYSEEISKFQLEKGLPVYVPGSRIDVWWNSVFQLKEYPALTNFVRAALSIITGPHVETSFSMMNDIIDKRSSRMDISTYSAIMKVKYGGMAEGVSCTNKFHRRNVLRNPVDRVLSYNMRMAHSRYYKQLKEKRKKNSEKKNLYQTVSGSINVRKSSSGKKRKAEIHQAAASMKEVVAKKISKKDSSTLQRKRKEAAKKVSFTLQKKGLPKKDSFTPQRKENVVANEVCL